MFPNCSVLCTVLSLLAHYLRLLVVCLVCLHSLHGVCCVYNYVYMYVWVYIVGMCMYMYMYVVAMCTCVMKMYHLIIFLLSYDLIVHSTGTDCSVQLAAAHWSEVTSSLPSSLTAGIVSRASHSVVVLGFYMLVYSGYRFSDDAYSYRNTNKTSNGADNPSLAEGEVLRYDLRSGAWESLRTTSAMSMDLVVMGAGLEGEETNDTMTPPLLPRPRYGHSAVVYNVSVYGRTFLVLISLNSKLKDLIFDSCSLYTVCAL